MMDRVWFISSVTIIKIVFIYHHNDPILCVDIIIRLLALHWSFVIRSLLGRVALTVSRQEGQRWNCSALVLLFVVPESDTNPPSSCRK